MKIQFPVKFLAPFERSQSFWLIPLITLGLASIVLRFVNLQSPLIEPHPWRQTQTALTTYSLFHKQVNFWFYESPFQGKLWSFVFEFPIYQGLTAFVMKTGLSLEAASRLVSIGFFCLSDVFLFLIVSQVFSLPAAFWSAFFYLISPFNIIFSRTALIDNSVQCFMLASLFFFLRWVQKSSLSSWFLFTISGALAAITKITIWFAPWAILCLYSLLTCYRSRILNRQMLFLGLGLGIQLLSYSCWSHWTDFHRSQSGFDATRSWIIGEGSARLELWRWLKISKWILRNILADWMVIPFLLGLWALKNHPKILASLCFIIFVPLILFFNVYTYHDYYLMAQVPYLIAIAGIGMASLARGSLNLKRIAFISMVAFIMNHLRILPVYLEPMFQKNTNSLLLENSLKSISSPDELLFVRTTENPWKVPLYSERLVATAFSEQWVRSGELNPSVFYFPSGSEDFSLLDSYKTVGVVPSQDYYFFRVKDSSVFPFDLTQMILLTDTVPENARILPVPQSLPATLTTCNVEQSKHPLFFEFSKSFRDQHKEFRLWHQTHSFVLPVRRFFALPNFQRQCQFEVFLRKGSSG